MSEETVAASPGPATQDPQVVSNPPGLPEISYRVDDFTGFRRALLRPLPGEQALSAWRPAPGDLGLQVLEWWAYLGDVLTFYNERIANESYLRTATQASSIANLVALLGYEPARGAAATGTLAVLSTAGHPAEPLVIPAGMALSSTASPGVPAQTFEVDAPPATTGQSSAPAGFTFTGQSNVPVTLSPDNDLKLGADGSPQSVLLAGRVSGVKAGDRLVLVGSGFDGTDDNWSLVTVTVVAPATDPGTGVVNTKVSFSTAHGGWGPTPPPEKSTAAPGPGSSADSTTYRLMRPAAAASLFNAITLHATSEERAIVQVRDSKPPRVQEVHLSAAVRAIAPGDMVLFDFGAGQASALAIVTGTSEALYTVPNPARPRSPDPGRPPSGPKPDAVTGEPAPPERIILPPPDIVIAHTVLYPALAPLDSEVLLAAPTEPEAKLQAWIASVAVRYGFKDVGTIIGVPTPELTLSSEPAHVTAAYPPPAGTTAFLQDTTGAGVLVQVGDADSGQVTISATDPSATGSLAVPLQLLVNLIPVSRGTTVTGEVLGSGNAALAGQSFTLSKSPLTYLASGSGRSSTLKVYVDQIRWQEVPSFYGQAPTAQVFVVTRSPDQTVTTVTFGDGVNGARLTSGTVTATYRYGSGAASPPAGRLTTISQPQLNLASVQNPVAVSPGADPQAPEDVRTDAPASVASFDRVISATDYEQAAAQAPGVSRAAASWAFDRAEQRTLVTVYVGDDQAAVNAATAALAGAEDPNRPVSVLGAKPINLSLSCTLVLAAGQSASTVSTAAQTAVSSPPDGPPAGLFSPGRMGIGQRLYRSAIDAALMVPGVTAVRDLVVTWDDRVLDEFFDPGPGSFFLPPDKVQITGVNADG